MRHIGRRYRTYILVGTLLDLLGAFLSLVAPGYISEITDLVSDAISGGFEPDTDSILALCLLLVIIYGSSLLCTVVGHIIIFSTSETIGKRMCDEMNAKVLRLDLNYLDRSNVGDVMSRMSNDADSLRSSSADAISYLISAAITVVVAVALMIATEPILTVVAVMPAVASVALMAWLAKRSQRYFRAQQRDLGRINGLVEGSYQGHDVMKVYNGERRARKAFDAVNRDLLSSMYRAGLAGQSMPLMAAFVNNLSYALVCIVGSMMIMDGRTTFGTVVAFIFYVSLFSRPLNDVSNSFSRLQTVSAAAERAFELLDAPDAKEDVSDEHADVFRGKVELRDVRFSYDEGKEVLHGVSYVAEPGTRTAIVGPTGAGKTTIASLLMRFYEPDSGSILIDGHPVDRMSKRRVRDMFSMVDQDAWTLNASVRDNLIYTKKGVTDEDMRRACRAVGIDDFIESLPEGYDTVIDDGFGLSAGQRQQLMIARAMIRDAPMVILDEATSSIDARTEKRIQRAMDALMEGRTSFIIAHRLSTIRDVDRIVVMKDGNIVETGTHESLLEAKGLYWKLYQSQFEDCDRPAPG